MQNNITSKFLIGIIVLIISACSNKKLENLGVLKKKASEYSIERKAPLVMPPDMFLSPPGEKKKLVEINRKKIDGSNLTLDDILLEKKLDAVKKNNRSKRKKLYKKEEIIEKILRTKAIVVLN